MAQQADAAYQEKNYLSAYSLYRRQTQENAEAYRAVFRAGLCAGYLSKESGLRMDELMDSYVQARRILSVLRRKKQLSPEFAEEEADRMLAELREFALGYPGGYGKLKSRVVFENAQDAQHYLSVMQNAAELMCRVSDVMELNHEDWKKELLSAAIDTSTRALKYDKLTYKDGMTEKDGKQVPVYGSFKADKEYRKRLLTLRERAVNDFNSLPSIVAQADRYTSEIEAEKAVLSAYQQARKRFLESAPEQKHALRRLRGNALLAAALLAVLFGLLAALVRWSWALCGLAALLLDALTLHILTVRFEKRSFPAPLLAQKSAAKQSRKTLAKKKAERRRFKSKTMKH